VADGIGALENLPSIQEQIFDWFNQEVLKGKIKNNGEIVGKILPVSGEKLDVAVRWKRLEKLD